MNSVPTNTFLSFEDIDDSSPLILPQQGPQLEDVPISLDDILPNDLLLDLDFDVNTLAFPPSSVPPQGGFLPSELNPLSYTANLTTPPPPQPGILPPVALQPTFDAFDGAYAFHPQPPALYRSGSSSAAFGDGGHQASLFGTGIQNFPVPTMSGQTPAVASASSSSSVNWTDPVTSAASGYEWSTGAPTPVVRTWEAFADSKGHPAATSASARVEPRQVAVPLLPFRRLHPLVRVDDTIEWVRPDVMKMVLYFNWSMNAEDEAHESWESGV
jgi:hypothetical protein